MRKTILFSAIATVAMCGSAMSTDGFIMKCGDSKGRSFYLEDPVLNPKGATWQDEASSSGKIFLVRQGDGWDIQFSDVLDDTGCRKDGAKVRLLSFKDPYIKVGAFHENYTDIYTFDLRGREVAWTSSKLSPFAVVSVHSASCEF